MNDTIKPVWKGNILKRDDICGISWRRLQCPHCGSKSVEIYEGETDKNTYYDGQLHIDEQSFPLQINCKKCGEIIRREGL